MTDYYIKVGKIDYYTWKIGAIVLFIILLIVMGVFKNGSTAQYQAEVNDAYWHMGYEDCSRYYNFTVDEMYVLNKYRIEKLNTGDENETKK